MAVQDAWGRTALHWAAAYACEASIVLLPGRGAQAALLSHSGQSQLPLAPGDMAAAAGHLGLAGFLSEHALMQLMKDHNVTLDDPMTASEPLLCSARNDLLCIPPKNLVAGSCRGDALDLDPGTQRHVVPHVVLLEQSRMQETCWWAGSE